MIASDHHPIILDASIVEWGPFPFRFKNVWLNHKDFHSSIMNWWEEKHHEGCPGYVFMKKLAELNRGLKFGIRGNEWLEELLHEIHMCKVKLEELTFKEEIMWRQKLKSRWVPEGDTNTQFFHSMSIFRKKSNAITKLQLEDGTITT